MSVETAADEHLEQAKAHIGAALSSLSEIVINQCWGHDTFSGAYKDKIKAAFLTLLKIRDEL